MSAVRSFSEPSAKTGYTVLAGAIVTILYSIITATTGFVPTPELVGASVVVATAAIALFVPAKSGKYVDWAVDPDDYEVIEGPAPDDDEHWEAEEAEGEVARLG